MNDTNSAREQPSKWRKRPVVIEAMRFDAGQSIAECKAVADWCGGEFLNEEFTPEEWRLSIHTLEGVMLADSGDWIIKGVQGEFYPCKPHIFAATYEAALPDEPATDSYRLPPTSVDAGSVGREAVAVNYAVVHKFAVENSVDYNALSRLIRRCTYAHPAPPVADEARYFVSVPA